MTKNGTTFWILKREISILSSSNRPLSGLFVLAFWRVRRWNRDRQRVFQLLENKNLYRRYENYTYASLLCDCGNGWQGCSVWPVCQEGRTNAGCIRDIPAEAFVTDRTDVWPSIVIPRLVISFRNLWKTLASCLYITGRYTRRDLVIHLDGFEVISWRVARLPWEKIYKGHPVSILSVAHVPCFSYLERSLECLVMSQRSWVLRPQRTCSPGHLCLRVEWDWALYISCEWLRFADANSPCDD